MCNKKKGYPKISKDWNHACSLLKVFDIQKFCTELESEGRESPSPEALDPLFKLGGSGGHS